MYFAMKIQSAQLVFFREIYAAHDVLLRKEWAVQGSRLTSDNGAFKGLIVCSVAWMSESLKF